MDHGPNHGPRITGRNGGQEIRRKYESACLRVETWSQSQVDPGTGNLRESGAGQSQRGQQWSFSGWSEVESEAGSGQGVVIVRATSRAKAFQIAERFEPFRSLKSLSGFIFGLSYQVGGDWTCAGSPDLCVLQGAELVRAKA